MLNSNRPGQVRQGRYVPSHAKNEKLSADHGVSFEDRSSILNAATSSISLSTRIGSVIGVNLYAYLVPCVEGEDYIVLKTIIPSRKATRKYIHGEGESDET